MSRTKKQKARKIEDSGSIAGRISANLQVEKLMMWLLTDILVFVFSVTGWCVAIRGGVTLADPGRILLDMSQEGMWNKIGGAVYAFSTGTVHCGIFLQQLLSVIAVLGMVETMLWVFSFITEYFRVRKMLVPLSAMADHTSLLAGSGDFEEIESALGSIDPTSDGYIRTGNRELRPLEESINLMLDRMRETYAAQTRFVSDASHELRTPIAVIKGYADMLDRWGKEDEKILDEGITAIRTESDNMSRLIEELLFIARCDNGRQTLSKTVFSLSDMMRGIHEQQMMIDDTHNYICDIRDEVTILADEQLILQAMRILCDNARKYTPKGNDITLRAYINDKGEPAAEVSDTGIGIIEEDIPYIFDRFYRSDPARNKKTGGSGLGLSIAKLIADRHKGYFDVYSVKDIGTRMTLCLPGALVSSSPAEKRPKETDDEN